MAEAEVAIGKWSRVTGTDRKTLQTRVADMYLKDGMSIRAIADEVGRSYGATHRLLVDAGVAFRPRGNPTTG
jgi:hypothetical protein